MEAIVHAFGIDWKLLAIQILNIGILVVLFKRYVYPPIFRIMEERQKKIEAGLHDAEEVKKERAAIADEKDAILASARSVGDELVKDIRSRTSAEATQTVRDAEARAAKIVADGEKLGERRKEEIITASKDELAKIAVKAAEAILRSRKA
jgi:F-type H+-transporting ATPase subunit b